MAMDFEPGAACEPTADAPGAGRSHDDLVAAIMASPGVVSTALAPSWTGGCDQVVALPILNGAAAGPVVAIDHDNPARLILLEVAEDRVLAIVIFDIGTSPATAFDADADAAMPIVESFAFQPAP